MNIITDPASFERGGKVKQEAGSGGFLKTTMNYNSGLINDKLKIVELLFVKLVMESSMVHGQTIRVIILVVLMV